MNRAKLPEATATTLPRPTGSVPHFVGVEVPLGQGVGLNIGSVTPCTKPNNLQATATSTPYSVSAGTPTTFRALGLPVFSSDDPADHVVQVYWGLYRSDGTDWLIVQDTSLTVPGNSAAYQPPVADYTTKSSGGSQFALGSGGLGMYSTTAGLVVAYVSIQCVS